ncbi:MAG: hypothetical protein SNJ84_02855, partial [Verrucomicrobiia bacterium]
SPKAMVLRGLLRRLGVEADVVLGERRGGEDGALPSPDRFDRVFVRLAGKDGKVLIDPSVPMQGGDYRSMYFPPGTRGLELDGQSDGLKELVADNRGLPRSVIRERFWVPGFEGETRLEMEIEHRNHAADQVRYLTGKRGGGALAEAVYRRLAAIYPEVRREGEMVFEDDLDNNVVRARGVFMIPQLWRWDPRSRTWSASFFPRETAAMTGRSKGELCEFAFPSRVEQTTEVHGIGGVVRPPRADELRTAGFTLRCRGRIEGEVLLLQYEFEDRASSREEFSLVTDRESSLLSSRLHFSARVSAPGASARRLRPQKEATPVVPPPARRY